MSIEIPTDPTEAPYFRLPIIPDEVNNLFVKPRPNHRIYIRVLREMGPERRLQKTFELSEFSRNLLRAGLRNANPDLDETALNRLYHSRMAKARNRGD
ncbi:MAG TPA: hypothetical protein VFI91_05115 [Longimicrobiaceae bacterium]|nr:hypothetical protein [Longimicrobiaceae bacterium]